ncbi:MAG: hypothetical protein IJ555_14850, partial [Ruminococcus sp.]|nr:hypothetical protein [Ruminococcus sp.]
PAPEVQKMSIYLCLRRVTVKMRVTAYVVQGDGIITHQNTHFYRSSPNRVVIPPAAVNAVVAQRGANVGGIGIRRKVPLTEQYR